jgi:hypothetical protein
MSSTDFAADERALPLTVVQPLAKKTAHTSLYRRLLEEGLDEPAALAVSRAVVDPADARQRLDRLVPVRVPGGRLFSLDVLAWAPAISNFPVNNREAAARTFPASGSGTTDEAARFRPLRPAQDAPDGSARLHQHADSLDHLLWSLERSVQYLLDHNSWVESIAAQGVMVPVTAVPMTIDFGDGSPDITVLATGDGSSRMASVHDILELTPRDVLAEMPENDRGFRGTITEITAVLERPASEISELQLRKIRAVQVPARVLLRFEPDAGYGIGFAKAVEALVHLVHVEPATQWDDAASLDAKADAVLAALYETGQITPTKKAYADGMLTPQEACSVDLGGEADERALWLLDLISSEKASVKRAVRIGVLELTRGKQLRKEVKAQIAVELGLRAIRGAQQAAYVKSARLALQSAVQSELLWGREIGWKPSMTAEELRDAALVELEEHGEPGTACARLAIQGGFWLAVYRVLREAHFFPDRDQRDGRSPQKILEALASSPHGLRVLYRAIIDGRDHQPPTSVDENGRRRMTVDKKPISMTSTWIRQEVVPSGGRPTTPKPQENFPTRQLMIRLRAMREAVSALEDAHRQLRSVTDAAGGALVDQEGVNSQAARLMQDSLSGMGRRLTIYEDVWRRRNMGATNDDALNAEAPLEEVDGEMFADEDTLA